MEPNLKKSAQRVQDVLKKHHLDLRVIEFTKPTRTAEEAAATIGCTVAQIAKTLIFKGKLSGKPVCVIASGPNRVDEKKIAHLVGEEIDRPDATYVSNHTGFSIGGIPPIGYQFENTPIIDEDLMQHDEIWAAAGTPNSVFCLKPNDLIAITQGNVIALKK